MTGRANGGSGQIWAESKIGVSPDSVGAYKNTDELKLANSLSKSLNFGSFSANAFAYHFVQRASGKTIKNLFTLFDAVLEVLAKRLDDEAVKDYDEYDCAIMAKRIQDALGKYKA